MSSSSSSSSSSSVQTQDRINHLYNVFNENVKEFLQFFCAKYGKVYPKINSKMDQFMMIYNLSQCTPIPAMMTWPMYKSHETTIQSIADIQDETLREQKLNELFTTYDVGDVKESFGIDPKQFWTSCDGSTREKIWDFTLRNLDALLDINDVRPFDGEKKKIVPTTVNSNSLVTEKKSNLSIKNDKKDDKTDETDKEEQRRQQEITNSLKETLSQVVGQERSSEMSKLFDEATVQNQDGKMGMDPEKMTSLFSGMISQLSRITHQGDESDEEDDEDDNDNENENGEEENSQKNKAVKKGMMSDHDAQRRKVRRQLARTKTDNKIKHIVSQMMGSSELETTDQSILEEFRRETEAEESRAKNPSLGRESGVAASCNFKLLELLNRLYEVRGTQTFKSDNTRPLFPQIKQAYDTLLQHFKENPNYDPVVSEIGKWAVEHEAIIKSKHRTGDDVFTLASHPWLNEFKAPLLWRTFDQESRFSLWMLAERPLQLAAVHYRLSNNGMDDIRDLIDGFLKSGGIGYDSAPSRKKAKKLMMDSLMRCAVGPKKQKMQAFLSRMGNPKDNALSNMMGLIKTIVQQRPPNADNNNSNDTETNREQTNNNNEEEGEGEGEDDDEEEDAV
jgi:hypothetical protein